MPNPHVPVQVITHPLFDVLSTVDQLHKWGLETGDILDQREVLASALSYLPTNVIFLLGGWPDLRFVIAGQGAVRATATGRVRDKVLVESRVDGEVPGYCLAILGALLEMNIPCRWDAVSTEWVPVRLGGKD